MEPNQIIRVAKEKHNMAKELAKFKDRIQEDQHKRKFEYTKFLYDLKEKYNDKTFQQSMMRIREINKLKESTK